MEYKQIMLLNVHQSTKLWWDIGSSSVVAKRMPALYFTLHLIMLFIVAPCFISKLIWTKSTNTCELTEQTNPSQKSFGYIMSCWCTSGALWESDHSEGLSLKKTSSGLPQHPSGLLRFFRKESLWLMEISANLNHWLIIHYKAFPVPSLQSLPCTFITKPSLYLHYKAFLVPSLQSIPCAFITKPSLYMYLHYKAFPVPSIHSLYAIH